MAETREEQRFTLEEYLELAAVLSDCQKTSLDIYSTSCSKSDSQNRHFAAWKSYQPSSSPVIEICCGGTDTGQCHTMSRPCLTQFHYIQNCVGDSLDHLKNVEFDVLLHTLSLIENIASL